jgi:hypothetical protein
MPQPRSLEAMVQRQIQNVLKRGQRMERFDQLRQRHFWSCYLFAPGAVGGTGIIPAGQYDIFLIPTGLTGQGYPAATPLTVRETNWLNAGRVPDNQNFVITEIGCTIQRPPAADANAPANSIWLNIPAGPAANIQPAAGIHPQDAKSILNGIVLEMGFLTNNVPIGLLSDFSQSSGLMGINDTQLNQETRDPVNGVPAAAFRRKLEVPILLQHGETMRMRLNVHRNIDILDANLATDPGTGWFEVRVDWWAYESFTEKS